MKVILATSLSLFLYSASISFYILGLSDHSVPMNRQLFAAASALLATTVPSSAALSTYDRVTTDCVASSIAKPTVFGAEVISINATVYDSYEGIPENNVCYVTVTITHPGTGDSVNNFIALPLTGWNGVFQGIGGGGYAAGLLANMANQTILGYSTGATDAGHITTANSTQDASSWALISTGNVNQYLLLDFARRSLYDMTVIGKAVSESFYDSAVKRSYWNGCSTSGRQGLVMAQYYPDDYDGILADAPAIQWNDFTL